MRRQTSFRIRLSRTTSSNVPPDIRGVVILGYRHIAAAYYAVKDL